MDEQTTPPPASNLTYEETPVITPQPEPSPHMTETPPPAKKPNAILGFFKGLVFFVILFIIGFVLSGYIRDFIGSIANRQASPSTTTGQKPTTTGTESTNTGTMVFPAPEATSASPTTQYVLNGLTRQAVSDISFTLPGAVLPLACDGSACGSQGTYLPGGTRFTVAARGSGQVLADFRGKIISDASGKPFTMSITTVAGKPATEFTNAQVGSTIGGFGFSQMHGYMIEITDTLSLEINHFSPSGSRTDFAADDAVFKTIVQSLTFGGTAKGSVIPAGVTSPGATPPIEPLAPIR